MLRAFGTVAGGVSHRYCLFSALPRRETGVELKGTKGIRYLEYHTSSLIAIDRGRDKVKKSVLKTANWDILLFNINETTSWEERAATAVAAIV